MRQCVLISAIAADLDRDTTGQVICGPRTVLACEAAVRQASGDATAIIVLTATKAGPEWDRVVMAEVMAAHIRQLAPDIKMVIRLAKTFDTIGEVEAVVAYVRELLDRGEVDSIEMAYFMTEVWRKKRVEKIIVPWFFRDLQTPYHVIGHASSSEFGYWYLYEFFARRKNRKRLRAYYAPPRKR